MLQISSLLSFLLLLCLYTSTPVCSIETEALALLTWRSSLKYPANLTTMWSYHISGDPCRWDGIKCNDAGSITYISYIGRRRTDDDYDPLDSDCDPIDGTLTKFNFSSLPNLTRIELVNNNLHGVIPDNIGGLHNLQNLDLSNNGLTGEFPRAILNLSRLELLSLYSNEFTGVIPKDIRKLSNLIMLELSNNKFSGQIPMEIGNMTRLEFLNFNYNELHGLVPNTIAQLSYLEFLQLHDNQLAGSIPSNLGNNNSMLSHIDVSNNNFIGTVPSFMCQGGNLLDFYASNNKFHNLLSVTLQNCTSLQHLDLARNSITADISHIFGKHSDSNLNYVDISQNHLYGRLPSNLDGLQNLVFFSLQGNDISGELPREFGNMTQLQVFNLDINNLVGQIPSELTNLPNIRILMLSNNKLSSLPMMKAHDNLRSLHLNNNKFVGRFPLLSGNWTSLVTLDLGENNFSGEIPAWIGTGFPVLQILRLRTNQFNGTIPPSLLKLADVQLLDLSNNNLIGSIPHGFSGMRSMAVKRSSKRSYIDLSWSYSEKIDVVWKGEGVSFQSTIELLTGIDLSCNSLSGEIPKDLIKLQGLVFLNLSRNQLGGMIPYYIGNLTWLEVLDLSKNHLSGIIPPSISHLTHLDMLNLSHNNLTGKIPLGSQIQTFNSSAFSDNYGLCGSPLPNNCSSHDGSQLQQMNNKGRDHKLDVIWVICSAILGFVVGFWVYFGILFWKASLRFAIFDFTDELQDKLMKW